MAGASRCCNAQQTFVPSLSPKSCKRPSTTPLSGSAKDERGSPWKQRVSPPERVRFGGGECGSRAGRRLLRNPRDEISDSEPARTVDPEAALHSVGVAGMADEGVAERPHVVG